MRTPGAIRLENSSSTSCARTTILQIIVRAAGVAFFRPTRSAERWRIGYDLFTEGGLQPLGDGCLGRNSALVDASTRDVVRALRNRHPEQILSVVQQRRSRIAGPHVGIRQFSDVDVLIISRPAH